MIDKDIEIFRAGITEEGYVWGDTSLEIATYEQYLDIVYDLLQTIYDDCRIEKDQLTNDLKAMVQGMKHYDELEEVNLDDESDEE